MSVQTRDFIDVAARARELGCRVPVRIALLPGNFATAVNAGEFRYHAATPYVRSAWQSVGLEDEGPEPREMTASAGHDRNSPGIPDRVPSGSQAARRMPDMQPGANTESARIPLAILFGAGLLVDPEWSPTIALGMVSRVLALHPDCGSPREVRLDIVVERQGRNGYACLEYRGDAYGLIALAREVRRIWEAASPGRRGEAVGKQWSAEKEEARKCESLSKGGGDA